MAYKSRFESSPGNHEHECEDCSTVWEHPDNTMFCDSHEEFVQEHSCPACGAQQYHKRDQEIDVYA